ncbi:MAG: alpha/beta hydrolase [Methanobrevibacter sp.]|nr:alpha/beta hydrolase [Methanobrevibacter sp.]
MSKLKNKLYYEEIGENNQELIIFLHSNLLSNWIWEKQRNFSNYHCIYLDIPNHGNSFFEDDFSISKSSEIIKDLIEEKRVYANGYYKKVHLVGIALGGQIILYLLAKYPELIDSAVVSGVNLKESYNNINQNNIEEILETLDKLKIDILDKKHPDFIIKGYLAEYGISKDYLDKVKGSISKINSNEIDKSENLNLITKKSLAFEIPELNEIDEVNEINEIDEVNEINEVNEGSKIDEVNEVNEINEVNGNNKNINLLVLYGTKEYPKVAKSARLIKNKFNSAKIFSVYRAIHLWNLIDCEWFNETIIDFIANKKIDLNDKPYLNKIE